MSTLGHFPIITIKTCANNLIIVGLGVLNTAWNKEDASWGMTHTEVTPS